MSALDGLRIVELSGGMAGALAGMVLAENGADVVKIERPGGDRLRGTPPFLVWHRGKRSVGLDLKSADGLATLDDLFRWADAAVEDFRPGVSDRLGFGWDVVKANHPHLVYVNISGFGERGRYKDVPGYEYVVSAATGRMATQNGYRRGPIFTPAPIECFGASMLATQGLLAAIHARRGSGRGQRVSTSLLHSLVTYDMTSAFGHRIHTPPAGGKAYGVMPVAFSTAETKDGRFLQMCSRAPHLFRNWMRAIGLEHLYDDPAYANMPDVFPTEEDMWRVKAMAMEKMKQKTAAEWLEIFEREDVGADPFFSPTEFLHCEQCIATGRRQEVIDPTVGHTWQIGPLGNFEKTPAVIGAPAPALGEHTSSTLTEAAAAPARPEPGPHKLRRPLEGITVIEAAFYYAAPFSATLLSEMGARVIKVEPPAGDAARRNFATYYTKETPAKESVIADLKTEEGREILYRLVEKADIFFHNFRPGVPEKLQIGYDTLRARNPRLIYIYQGAFGSTGPWARKAGYHSSPNAIAGVGYIEGGAGNPPINRTYGDPAGALGLATTMMVALHAREETGDGQYVETTMLSTLAYAVSGWSIDYEGKPEGPFADKGQHGFHALCRLYEADDSSWLFLMAPRQREWERLIEVIDAPELGSDPRFATEEARLAHDDELVDLLAGIIVKAPASQWQERLLAARVAGVRADGIDHLDFMLNDQHVRDNGLSIPDKLLTTGEEFWRANGCVEFSDMERQIDIAKPLGWATDAVLAEIGYDQTQIDDLRARGITAVAGNGL